MRIQRVQISQFMGIEEITLEVPESGMVIEGSNARGKTSVLLAVRAALAAQGIDKSAIRRGASKSQILVDLGVVQVTRNITEKSDSLKITHPGGLIQPRPQTWLTELLGLSPLDPLRLFLEQDADERMQTILSAIPITVTAARLRTWAPQLSSEELCEALSLGSPDAAAKALGEDLSLGGHGLAVLSKVAAFYYRRRTDLNREVVKKKTAAEEAAASARVLTEGVRAAGPRGPASPEVAVEAHGAAKAVVNALGLQLGEAAKAEERMKAARGRIDELRAKAASDRTTVPLAPGAGIIEEALARKEAAGSLCGERYDELERVRGLVRAAETALHEAKTQRDEAETQYESLVAQEQAAQRAGEAIVELETQALELEQALGEPPAAPTKEQLAEATQAAERAALAVKLSRKAEEAMAAMSKAQGLVDEHAAIKSASDALTRVIDALTKVAPGELLSGSNGIPGLAVDGDDVLLDGVSLRRVSGAERMFFAVEIARRLNAKSKLLIVDGLEVLDPENFGRFIQMATRDGYQLIATRVGSGDATVRPIASDEEPAADDAKEPA